MELKQILHARRAKNRVVSSYKQRGFIGFKRPKVNLYHFKSFYFAHIYTTRYFLLGIKMPLGACVSSLALAGSWHGASNDETQTRQRLHHVQKGLLLSHGKSRQTQFQHHAYSQVHSWAAGQEWHAKVVSRLCLWLEKNQSAACRKKGGVQSVSFQSSNASEYWAYLRSVRHGVLWPNDTHSLRIRCRQFIRITWRCFTIWTHQ